jgi:hypothetical protein
MAIDAATIARVRNLIPDDSAIFGDAGDEYLFTDEQIEYFYLDGNENIKWAAGLAKITVGSSEALILKVIKNYETSTDGAALAKQWLAMGQALIDQGKDEFFDSGYEMFDIVYRDSDALRPEGLTYGFPGWRV